MFMMETLGWSFSTAQAIASLNAQKHGQYVALSEQQLIDCTMNGQYTCQMGM